LWLIEGERKVDRGCERGAAAGGEAVEAVGASVMFAPVVGSGGWPWQCVRKGDREGPAEW